MTAPRDPVNRAKGEGAELDEKLRVEVASAGERACALCLETQAQDVVVVAAGGASIVLCQECAPNVADEIHNKQWQLSHGAATRDEVTAQEIVARAACSLDVLLDELVECTVRWSVGPLAADKRRIATGILERLAALGIARKVHRAGCEIWPEHRLCACPWEVPS